MPPDHNAVLRAAAKDVLGPLGLVQKGRSRVWLDDRVWHVIAVEFQPSSWSKGSYLNVAAMWLWNVHEHISFDYAGSVDSRVQEFEPAGSEDWPARSRSLAELAAERVNELRAALVDLPTVAREMRKDVPNPGWPMFHAAIANGLAGETDRARDLFDNVTGYSATYDWVRDLQDDARQLRTALDDPARFREQIIERILRGRQAQRLPTLTRADVEAALGEPFR